ncbi:unnamed protein product [Citrullus colocynthis]|uniref:Uncharacterized protein n=1 Tax=Citrullus colocynthis TaxID=252529 RepID=A0ABP0YAD6_9ROSI
MRKRRSALLKIFQSRGAEAEFHALAISDDGDIRNSMVSLSSLGNARCEASGNRALAVTINTDPIRTVPHTFRFFAVSWFFPLKFSEFSAVQSSDFLVGSPFGIRVRRRKLACSLTERMVLDCALVPSATTFVEAVWLFAIYWSARYSFPRNHGVYYLSTMSRTKQQDVTLSDHKNSRWLSDTETARAIVPFTLEPNLILSVLLPSPVNLLLPLAPCPLEQVSLCRQLLVMTAFKKSRKVLFANLDECLVGIESGVFNKSSDHDVQLVTVQSWRLWSPQCCVVVIIWVSYYSSFLDELNSPLGVVMIGAVQRVLDNLLLMCCGLQLYRRKQQCHGLFDGE